MEDERSQRHANQEETLEEGLPHQEIANFDHNTWIPIGRSRSRHSRPRDD